MKNKEKFARIEIVANISANYEYNKMGVNCNIWVNLKSNNKNIRNGIMKIIIQNNRIQKIEVSYEYEYNDIDDRTYMGTKSYVINGDYVEYLFLRQDISTIVLYLRYNSDVGHLIDLFKERRLKWKRIFIDMLVMI